MSFMFKGIGKCHTRRSSVGEWSWSQTLGSQPAGDSMHSHEPCGGLPSLSARPAVTFPAVERHRP